MQNEEWSTEITDLILHSAFRYVLTVFSGRSYHALCFGQGGREFGRRAFTGAPWLPGTPSLSGLAVMQTLQGQYFGAYPRGNGAC
jgi:hypothetical protein